MENFEGIRTKAATLQTGFKIFGKVHKEIVLREEQLKDNFSEIKEIEEVFGENVLSEEEKKSDLVKACVQFRRRIVKIGDLSGEDLKRITAKDYLENLSSCDYMILLSAKGKLDQLIEKALIENEEEGESSKKK